MGSRMTFNTSFWILSDLTITNSTNQTANNPVEAQFVFGTIAQVGYTLFAAIIIVFDLLGNVTIIHIVRTRPHMRSNTNILISNLAFSDILMVPTCVYMTKYLFVGYRWFGGTFGLLSCKAFSSITLVSVTSSVYTILVIAVERFFAVVFPMSKLLHRKSALIFILLIWFGAVVCAVPESMIVTVRPCGNHVHCCVKAIPSAISYTKYTTGVICVTYFIPLVTICTLYFITGYKLWASKTPGHYRQTHAQTRLFKRKAIRMLVAVITVFSLCWFPLYLAEVLKMYKTRFYYSSVPVEVQFILPWFGVANSSINPYLFPIFCEKFRQEFKLVLRCSRKYQFSQPSSQASYRTRRQYRNKSSVSFIELANLPFKL